MLRRLARQHEVADRHAARIETHHEWGDRAGRHERAGTIDVAHRLGHRLGHVRSRMEKQLHQGKALNVLRLDVMDARDVEEVVLVVIREIPFHLRRVHAAVRLANVDHRQIQAGEDVNRHLANRQHASQRHGNHRNHHGNGTPQGKENEPHDWETPIRDTCKRTSSLLENHREP